MTNKIIETEKPIDHVDRQATSNNFTDERNKKMSNSLQLFPSQPSVTGGYDKTSFATTPEEITEDNASEFFQYDHTSIKFKDGHSTGDNFEYATAIPLDIDNSDSDEPEEWTIPKELFERLKEMGINFWIVASRHHKIPKLVNVSSKDEEGNVIKSQEEKAARPKFHVYLPLSEPLDNGDKYVRYCEWCIKTFKADPKVKSKAQKIFGYGDSSNAFVKRWSEGRCIDEVLTDDDLVALAPPVAKQKQKTPLAPSACPANESNTAFDEFVNSGEWRNRLGDLEALGWEFFEKDGVLYFQTPDGDHSPGKQDGNINGGVAYFFSKAPPPFENDKGYSIPQLFAGVLFGDIGKKGLAKFAKKYLPGTPVQYEPKKIGIEILDSFVQRVEGIAFPLDVKMSDYYVESIEYLLRLALEQGWDLGIKNEPPYFFNGEYWQWIDWRKFQRFLQTVGLRQGIPRLIVCLTLLLVKN